jgi:hypothetical protein
MRAVFVLSCLALVLPAAGQEAQQPADQKQVLDEVLAQFKKEGIELDSKAQTVTIPATVNEPQQ